MKTLAALSLPCLFFGAVACSTPDDPSADAGTPIDATTPTDTGAHDLGAPIDMGFPPDATPDGGISEDAEPTDSPPADTGSPSPVLVSNDVLVRPSRLSTDGHWLAYFESYSEQPNQLATNGQLHFFETTTATDHQVASNVSPLNYQISDDWSRALYFSRIDTTDLTARAFTYDRALGTSAMIANAAFFQGIFGRDGITAVVAEAWDQSAGSGEILQWELATGTMTSRTTDGSLIYRHDLSRWYLYLDRPNDALHIAGIGGDALIAEDVAEESIVVSNDNLYIAYVRTVGATGGALERSNAAGTTTPIATGVRPNLVSISGRAESLIYGSGLSTDETTDLWFATMNGAPSPIATGALASTVVISPTHGAVAYCVSSGVGVGALHLWTPGNGDQVVAPVVPTTVRPIVADDGSAVAYFAIFDGATSSGQLVRWTSASSDTLGEAVSRNAIARTANLERLAFVDDLNVMSVGDLKIFSGTLPALSIASGVAAQLSLPGASTGYHVSDSLEQAVAFVAGGTPAIGELHGWSEGGSPGVIASGVPVGSWRLTPDRRGLVFLADFVDESSGADHGTLQVASYTSPIPTTIHASVGRYFTVSNGNVAYVAVRAAAPSENGLFVAPLP